MDERETGNETLEKMAQVFRLWYFILSKTGSPWKILIRHIFLESFYWLYERETGEAGRGGYSSQEERFTAQASVTKSAAG